MGEISGPQKGDVSCTRKLLFTQACRNKFQANFLTGQSLLFLIPQPSYCPAAIGAERRFVHIPMKRFTAPYIATFTAKVLA